MKPMLTRLNAAKFVLVALATFSCINALVPTAIAQGDLSPTGPPAPTMKTLQQVEPRTPISRTNVPCLINIPGSYYLTENLFPVGFGTNVITILASDVTLDLNGFTIVGATEVSGAEFGIRASGLVENIAIKNGIVRFCNEAGISVSLSRNSQFEKLQLLKNGARGLEAGQGSLVSDCSARENQSDGILASSGSIVINCVAINNQRAGIVTTDGSTLKDCIAAGNVTNGIIGGNGVTVTACTVNQNGGDGIALGENSTVAASSSVNNSGDGISVKSGSTLGNCTAAGNGGDGISAESTATMTLCTVKNNGADGIRAFSFANISGCTADSNVVYGIAVSTGANISRCTATRNRKAGIGVLGNCRIMENVLTGNGSDDGAGIYLGSVDSVVDGNHLIGNLRGIHSDAAGSNLIIRNTMSSNNTNLVLSANQKVAVVVLPPNSPAINGNTGAAGVGTTDPWANFRY